jgi:hypothetical protein
MNLDPGGGGRRPKRKQPTLSAVTNALTGGGAQAPAVQPHQSSMVDLSMDPILQQIHAANLANVQGAQAGELAGRKQALIDYGDEPGMESLFPDESTRSAAHGNAFSALANLLYEHQQQGRGIDENLNHQNLFYSSEHNRQNADEEHRYQQGRSGASRSLRSALSGLGAALLAAQGGAAMSNAQGASDAYSRYQPPSTIAAPAGAPPAAPGGGTSSFGSPTPKLPTFDTSKTTLPTFDLSQTTLPTFHPPQSPKLPTFDTSKTTLPTFDPNSPLLQALANGKRRGLGGVQ